VRTLRVACYFCSFISKSIALHLFTEKIPLLQGHVFATIAYSLYTCRAVHSSQNEILNGLRPRGWDWGEGGGVHPIMPQRVAPPKRSTFSG